MPSEQLFKGRERESHLEMSLLGTGSDAPKGASLGPRDGSKGASRGRCVCCRACRREVTVVRRER